MVNELKRPVDLPESSNAAKHACSDDVDQRNCGLEAEHTIFLSHSGKQKNFTEHLWKELKRAHHCPFFDKCPDSLPKGHDFPSAIIQAARQCHVAIPVLSEDFFTRSRWPMIELHEFVKAQASTNSKLKLLPLFYKLSVEEFKDAERQKRWQDIWEGWAAEDVRTNKIHKVDVGAWASALSVVGRTTGLEYVEEVGKVAYVENVVEAVGKLKVPRVKYDVSHVQSLRRLCEAIFAKFDDSKDNHHHYKVQVVGLFGMGGVGKTTITKAMCNGRFGDFVGEFCHVELGVKDVGEVRRQGLQDLTGEANLPHDLNKLKTLLKTCMQHRKVFLCLDNVWLEDIEEAKMYLQLNYKVGSKVLVTSRCFETLQSLGLQDCHCMEMPELNKCDATELFLHLDMVSTSSVTELEWEVIDRCVEACHFLKPSLHDAENDSSTKEYLPLALKVWNSHQGESSNWQQRRLESKDLPSLRRLGEGLSGFLYETKWNGRKYVRKDFPLGSVHHNVFEKEAIALLDLEHPNIVMCSHYTVGKSSCSLLLQYVDDDLQNFIQKRIDAQGKGNRTGSSTDLHSRVLNIDETRILMSSKAKGREIAGAGIGRMKMPENELTVPVTLSEALDIILQIATGVEYLHDNGIVHGDLKPKNVLVDYGRIVKLVDFGLLETKKRIKLVSKHRRHFDILIWKAPELFTKLLGPISEDSDDPFTDSDTDEAEEVESSVTFTESRLAMADVYSFGLICSQILGGKLVYPNLSLNQLREQRMHGFRPQLPSTCPNDLQFLIFSSVQRDPWCRPTFTDICTALKAFQSTLLKEGVESVETDESRFSEPNDASNKMNGASSSNAQ